MKNKKFIIFSVGSFIIFIAALILYLSQDSKSTLGKIEFSSTDIYGNSIDSSIFNNYDITMINIWGTFCGPCIEEMPDIQELYEEMSSKNINVIGIVEDINNPNSDYKILEEAMNIAEKTGVKYKNIVPDEKLKSGILRSVTGVPTTFFVDNDGNIVGKFVVGTRSKQQYQKKIEEILKIINK